MTKSLTFQLLTWVLILGGVAMLVALGGGSHLSLVSSQATAPAGLARDPGAQLTVQVTPAAEKSFRSEPISEPIASANPPSPEAQLVTVAALTVRGSPSKNGVRLGSLARDDLVTVVKEDGNWRMIRGPGGIDGWVFAKYLGSASDG